MFISDESCLVGFPGFPGPGRTAWRMVERDSEELWYHVRLRIREGEGSRSKKCMPADSAVLAHLLSQQSPDNTIEEVQVVTAPCMNGSNSDRMEKLVSLVIGYDQSGECVLIHKVAGGAVYSSAHNSLDAGSLIDARTIYEDA
ncbi:hypothetical protein SAMN05216487_4662 [Pseudomonas sp. UC 17F4]|nr:hypothetical protein SAMN05216487_4662 [Pseudomonas sp. UC 17F4]